MLQLVIAFQAAAVQFTGFYCRQNGAAGFTGVGTVPEATVPGQFFDLRKGFGLENGKLAVANPDYCLDIDTAKHSLAQILHYKSHTYICFHGGEWQIGG